MGLQQCPALLHAYIGVLAYISVFLAGTRFTAGIIPHLHPPELHSVYRLHDKTMQKKEIRDASYDYSGLTSSF